MLADLLKKIKGHESELWLVVVVLLLAGVTFGSWRLATRQDKIEPLKIENVPMAGESRANPAAVSPVKSGIFVASKNGTKYYLPTCPGVKRIKEENKIYFNAVAEAEARGLTPAANCPGL